MSPNKFNKKRKYKNWNLRRKECKLKSNIWVLKAKSNGLPFYNWVSGEDKENGTEEMLEGILTENF